MITRFAPSPTGPLHLGHVYSAMSVWNLAERMDGTALLRIEDTDSTRVRPEFEQMIYDDLSWLGFEWPHPVRRQSDHYSAYKSVLTHLAELGVLYPCSCNRRTIQAAGAVAGVDGFIYPGTCRHRMMSEASPTDAVRLNVEKAMQVIQGPLSYENNQANQNILVHVGPTEIQERLGDPVLQRKDTNDPAYHLACTHDDAVQGITHVVRGIDVAGLTPIHVLLQRLMGWHTPVYHHHNLVLGSNGKRLAKITKSKSIATFREDGLTPEDVKLLIQRHQTSAS